MKITQAPPEAIKALHRFAIAGTATPKDVGRSVIVSINNEFKMTGPPVHSDGTWRLDLIFPKPGQHTLVVSLGDEKVDLSLEVVGPNGEKAPPPAPAVPANGPLHAAETLSAHSVGVPPTSLPGRTNGAPPPQGTPNGPTLAKLVEEAHVRGYSDVHLGVGREPRFRNRGQIQITNYNRTDEATFFSWMREILPEAEVERFHQTLDYDGAAQYPFARVRVNIFETLTGPAMVLRLIPMEVPKLEDLGLPKTFADICHSQKGLILITGPTGSGKSTTLAAMVNYINQTMQRHIITIEDPIEFVHQSHRSIISQREVGIHSKAFDVALRASLREDPDVILIGEMRDRETLETALKAAQTGHLVFGTLHTNSAVKTLERILALYEPEERPTVRLQIAESAIGVIAQGLVPTTDNKRAPYYEVLITTDAVRDYIKKGDIDELNQIIPRSDYEGMCTMNQSLHKLYLEGRINEEIALEFSPQQNEMAILLRGGTVYGDKVEDLRGNVRQQQRRSLGSTGGITGAN